MSESLLWPFESVGRYRLSLVEEGAERVPFPVAADDAEAQASFVWRTFRDERRHVGGLLFLDDRERLIGYTVGSIGQARAVGADPGGMLLAAWLRGAASVVLFQRLAPGQSARPTPEDLEFTETIAEIGRAFGKELVDHLIVLPTGRYVSLRSVSVRGWSWPRPAVPRGRWPRRAATVRRSLPVKFRHPERQGTKWAGTGTPPRWLLRELAGGRPAEDLVAEPHEPAAEVRGLALRLTARIEDLDVPDGASTEALREILRQAANRWLTPGAIPPASTDEP